MLKNTFTHWIGSCLLSLLLALPVFSQTISNVTFSPTSVCAGSAIQVAFDTAGFTAGTNKFTVELSDAAGSFTSKRVLNADASLTNTITLPNDLVGTGFEIRITASSPVVETIAAGALVIKSTPAAPVSTAGFGLGVCQGNPPLDLGPYVTGSNLKWYSYTELWAPIDTVVAQSVSYVPNTTPASTSPHIRRYRITQTIDGCESSSYASISVNTSYPVRRTDDLSESEKSMTVYVGQTNVPFPKANDWQTLAGEPIADGSFVPTATAGIFKYTRKLIINCETPDSIRDTLTVTVQSISVTPAVASIELCPGSTAPDIASLVTVASGATLKWYDASGNPITKPSINTATAQTFTYQVSQTEAGKYESSKVQITVQVKAAAAPTLPTATIQYCLGGISDVLPQQAGWQWYTTATGGTALAATFKPSTATAGTTPYYVENTTSGCVSTSRAKYDVQVISVSAPTLASASVEYCLNASAVVLPQVANRVWYVAQTGGTALAGSFTPSTATAGSTSYWVANRTGDCESERVEYKVIVTSVEAPVLTEVTKNYCIGTAATAVTVLPQATNRVWYTSQTGGTALVATFKPSTTTAGTTSYWAANKVGSCESERVEYKVTVLSTPAPTVANLQACAGETLKPLTATGTDLKWYTVATGGSALVSAPIPSNVASGSYYVSQTLNNCEGPRAEIRVTINAIPAAPGVTNLETVCQDQTVASSALLAAVTKANGATLKWYTSLTDTNGVSTTPTVSTATDGLKEFVVSQSVLGCASPKSVVKLEVKALPAVPKVTETIDYCHKEVGAVALTAEKSPTNNTLNWYTVATGGSAVTTAPIPATTAVGTKPYYVSQVQTYTVTGGTLKCESKRSLITVVTNALPVSPTTKDIEECQTKEAKSITLTATHGTGNTLKWYDNATIATSLTTGPVVDQSKVLKKSYFVTQVNTKNCESEVRQELKVNIKLLPVAPQVVTVDKCQFDTPTQLTAGTVAGASLKWWGSNASGGSFTTTAPTPVFEKGEASHYYVSQILEGCESDRAKLDVIVKTTPKPTVSQTTFVYCQNAQSSVLSAQGQRLTWYLGNQSGPDAIVPSTNNIGRVSYYVAQTGDNGCISPKEEIKVTVNPKPSAAITGSTKIELGQVADLVINFTGGGPWSYVLSDNTEGTTETNPLIIKKSPQKTTTYSIKEVSNVCGLGTPNGSAFVEVLVPAINTGNPAVASICAKQNFTIPFQASAISVPQFEYKLQISKDTVDANFVSIPTTVNGSNATGTIPENTAGGDYYIRLIVESTHYEQPVKGTVSQVVLTVRPLPVATISGSKTILIGESAVVQIDFSGTGPWHYMMGNETELTTTSISPIYKTVQPDVTTTYTMKEVQNECGVGFVEGEARIQVDPILANEPVIVANDWLQVFPVPVQSYLTVQVKELFVKGTIVVTVTDMAGRVVKKESTMNRISEIDFSQLAGGMYFVRVENGDLVSVTKVTKY